jgi:hypothetical protein
MVRHEAAEALGGIASDGVDAGEGDAFDAQGREVVDVLGILREWAVKPDAPLVVRESCQVAIDMWEVGFSFLSLCLSIFISCTVPPVPGSTRLDSTVRCRYIM